MKNISLPDKIGPFIKYTKKPNAIKFGTLYTRQVKMDVPFEQTRTLRVYLPEDFDPNKRYPIMYMCDAQNIVDRYTSAYGEWDFDETMHRLIKQGYRSFIVAGLDCPKNILNRIREYTISKANYKISEYEANKANYKGKKPPHGYGDKYAKYLIEVIKPMIDKYFPTEKDREYTSFGGSSMGGLCAFDMVSTNPEVFSFALSFSPAFFVMNQKEYKEDIHSRIFYPNEQKYYFFTGGADLDAKIMPGTIKMYEYMKRLGFDDEHVALLVDSERGHCEASWSHYLINACKFWLKK